MVGSARKTAAGPISSGWPTVGPACGRPWRCGTCPGIARGGHLRQRPAGEQGVDADLVPGHAHGQRPDQAEQGGLGARRTPRSRPRRGSRWGRRHGHERSATRPRSCGGPRHGTSGTRRRGWSASPRATARATCRQTGSPDPPARRWRTRSRSSRRPHRGRSGERVLDLLLRHPRRRRTACAATPSACRRLQGRSFSCPSSDPRGRERRRRRRPGGGRHAEPDAPVPPGDQNRATLERPHGPGTYRSTIATGASHRGNDESLDGGSPFGHRARSWRLVAVDRVRRPPFAVGGRGRGTPGP